MLTKTTMTLLLCLSVVSVTAAIQQLAPLDLPPQARVALYEKFPDWQFVNVSDEIREVLKRDCGPNIRPDLISGDFDGDGQADYAALISHGVVRNDDGEVIGPRWYLLVFLAQA